MSRGDEVRDVVEVDTSRRRVVETRETLSAWKPYTDPETGEVYRARVAVEVLDRGAGLHGTDPDSWPTATAPRVVLDLSGRPVGLVTAVVDEYGACYDRGGDLDLAPHSWVTRGGVTAGALDLARDEPDGLAEQYAALVEEYGSRVVLVEGWPTGLVDKVETRSRVEYWPDRVEYLSDPEVVEVAAVDMLRTVTEVDEHGVEWTDPAPEVLDAWLDLLEHRGGLAFLIASAWVVEHKAGEVDKRREVERWARSTCEVAGMLARGEVYVVTSWRLVDPVEVEGREVETWTATADHFDSLSGVVGDEGLSDVVAEMVSHVRIAAAMAETAAADAAESTEVGE